MIVKGYAKVSTDVELAYGENKHVEHGKIEGLVTQIEKDAYQKQAFVAKSTFLVGPEGWVDYIVTSGGIPAARFRLKYHVPLFSKPTVSIECITGGDQYSVLSNAEPGGGGLDVKKWILHYSITKKMN